MLAFQKELYRIREACSVDEEPPRGPDDVELCIIEARSRRRHYEIVRRWNDAVGRIGGPQLDPAGSYPEYALEQHMRGVRDALAWEDGIWDGLRDWLRVSGIRVPEQPASASLATIADTLRTAALYVTERELTARLESVRKHLADGASYSQASSLWRSLLDASALHPGDRDRAIGQR
jgi:hypothetical protein